MTTILGIAAYYHDSSAAILRDGIIVAAAQEERFTRKKHDASFPRHAVNFCLGKAGLRLDDVDHIVFYEKPFLKFERLLETYATFAPRGLKSFSVAMPVWLREKLFQKSMLISEFKDIDHEYDDRGRLQFCEHHVSHAASAFFPSPFDEAVVLTLDGVGEWTTSAVALGRENQLQTVREIHFPHSLGLLYSAFTYYTGFRVNSGEYKLMGLAPYGTPRFAGKILSELVDVKDDGSFWLNQDYFDYCTGLVMTNDRFSRLFGEGPREPDGQPLTQFHMDIASSIQAVTEEIVLKMARQLRRDFDIPNLCLAGGVALNCVANGKLLKEQIFDRLWIQPAAGDSGGSLGAALALWHLELAQPRSRAADGDAMKGSFLGPEFTQVEIEQQLRDAGAVFHTLSDEKLIDETAAAIAAGNAVGWFNGRMEFGPRALGGRSILADPRSPTMQKKLNLKIKFREDFRPFAPSVLREAQSDWFDIDVDSPYMLLVAGIAEKRRCTQTDDEQDLIGLDKLDILRSEIPAVTHVDYSARVQSVDARTNPRYHALIKRFGEITGCPVLVNTSFNVRGEPIVCTPSDAFRCFMGTHLEFLVCGNAILRKHEQDVTLHADHTKGFSPD
ncbi:MAG: carbamoyltransferase [Hyphomicrobiaceae bacterium]